MGMPVNKCRRPWNFEVGFGRPTNINTAVGVLLSQGIQTLFHSINSGGSIVSGVGSIGFDGGKGTANAPDFSGVPPTNMPRTTLLLYATHVNSRPIPRALPPG